MDSPLARIAAIAIASTLVSACSMSPAQKKWAGIVGGVLVVGAMAARADHGPQDTAAALSRPGVPCYPQPDGSCR